MLIVNHAGAGQVRYWTAEAVHARWIGEGSQELGLAGGFQPGTGCPALAATFEGRMPPGTARGRQGDFLTARPGARRRQGWDLIFAAPKSVSVLTAALPTEKADLLVGAFRRATDDAMALLEDRAAHARYRNAQTRARGIVAAAFEHRTNAAGEPHLHSHVALANLALLPDGSWGCLAGARLREWTDALAGCFHLSLRARLRQEGLNFSWRVHPGGAADIVDPELGLSELPTGRALAVRAESLRSGSPGTRAARVALGRSRNASPNPSRDTDVSPGGGTPRGRPSMPASPLGSVQAMACLDRAESPAFTPPPPPSAVYLRQLLAERTSRWSEADVWVALARACPDGMLPATADAVAREWGAAKPPDAGLLDEDAYVIANAGVARRHGAVSPAVTAVELDQLRASSGVRTSAEQLLSNRGAVSVLGPGDWLVQAAVVDAARAAWQSGGKQVHVL
ncbi:MAG TPA: MobF family relaxase, partial [Acidimicrobiales bacterium]|nr:MobF family relaxase [Acidimicrobiales bacterium]